MKITIDQINAIAKPNKGELYIVYINKYADKFSVNTKLRMSHFLGQIMHETANFKFAKEIASGAAYDTGRLAKRLGNTPETDGDGQLYKGRGLIMVTGHDNYKAFSLWLYKDLRLLANPTLVEKPEVAVLAAFWYWSKHDLNELADKDDAVGITHKINGGDNGLKQRIELTNKAKAVL